MSINSRRSKDLRGKGQNQKGSATSHEDWVFKPKLENEAVVLHSILDDYSIEYYSIVVTNMKELITSLVRNHGFTDGSKRYNIIKNYTINLIEGREPENPAWLATSKAFNVPSCLGIEFSNIIIDMLNNTEVAKQPKYYQAIITTLNIVRIVKGLACPDFTPVTDKAITIDYELLREFETYVSNKLKEHKFDNTKRTNLGNYRFHLNKNGPNEVPKIESAYDEAIALFSNALWNPFHRLCDEMNCAYLSDYLRSLNDLKVTTPVTKSEKDRSPNKIHLRKLVKVPDSGFKVRIVAIADFWTQLILEPVRDHVQEVTKRIFSKTDFRLNQDLGITKMRDFQNLCLSGKPTKNGKILDIKYLKFYDISSWTDRFHRDLQKITMKNLFSPRLAENWAQLVVHCSWYSPDLGRTIKYGQGQGMGTVGSFDIATLTDHLFINFIYEECMKDQGLLPDIPCYGKVGDDLWIYDPEDLIPFYYQKINLPINESKSKTFCELGSVAEFCSRTFLNGIDCSRISPNIINRSKDFRYIPSLLALCADRGIQLVSSSFESLQRKLKGSEETYYDKLQDWLIAMMVIGKQEQSSHFQSLNYDYLTAGNWLGEGRLKAFLSDPDMSTRLLICHSIVEIERSFTDIVGKVEESIGVTSVLGSDIITLTKDNNLFDQTDPGVAIALQKQPDKSILLPKEIILLERFMDQHHLVSEGYTATMDPNWELTEPGSILEYANFLNDIATRSNYDQGNINYDSKRVYNTQFNIVKVMERCNEDITTFDIYDSNELDWIMQELQYEDLMDEYAGILPTLNVVPE